MRTGSLLLFFASPEMSVEVDIYFSLDIGYVVYVVYVVYVYVVVYVGLSSMTFSWAGDLGWPLSGHITKGRHPYIKQIRYLKYIKFRNKKYSKVQKSKVSLDKKNTNISNFSKI